MKTKDWVIFGLIIGIALFFFGAMIASIFIEPTAEGIDPNYAPDKASKAIKLIGLGVLTTTLIVGGVIGNDLHKHFKLILLVIGLVLLLIFSIGAQFMKWDDTPSYYYGSSSWGSGIASSPSDSGDEEISTAPPSTPGFELIAAIGAIAVVLMASKIKRRK